MSFCGFDFFPGFEYVCGGVGLGLAEYVGVAADHFCGGGFGDVVDGEAAGAAGEGAVEDDLEEDVAEFFGEEGVVAAVDGFEGFVGFFDHVGFEGLVGLFEVPGAAVGFLESFHYAYESSEWILYFFVNHVVDYWKVCGLGFGRRKLLLDDDWRVLLAIG